MPPAPFPLAPHSRPEQGAGPVLITGASGYLGRNIARALLADGHVVRGLARSSASAEIVAALGAEVARGDLTDVPSLRQALRGAAALIHAAADTDHGGNSKAQAFINLQGTQNIYDAAREAGVRRAVHISTEAVLLTGKPLRNVDETAPVPAHATGGYSRTKAGAERIALQSSGGGLEVVVVRPRFVWGRDDTTALPQLIAAAKSGRLAWIDGGHYLTSTTHVDNVVAGVLLALRRGRAGEIYFISDGEAVPFRRFVTDLLATQGIAPPDKSVPRWLVEPVVRLGAWCAALTGGAISGPMSWQEYATLGNEVTLDISKARRELGYAPVIDRAAGLLAMAKAAGSQQS